MLCFYKITHRYHLLLEEVPLSIFGYCPLLSLTPRQWHLLSLPYFSHCHFAFWAHLLMTMGMIRLMCVRVISLVMISVIVAFHNYRKDSSNVCKGNILGDDIGDSGVP